MRCYDAGAFWHAKFYNKNVLRLHLWADSAALAV
jgi:hypothetical protein